MSAQRALLTFSLGPVQAFIAQARRVADLWAGSDLLSHLVTASFGPLSQAGGTLVFPAADLKAPSEGFPNRFVAELPLENAELVARKMEEAVRAEWNLRVAEAVAQLEAAGIPVTPTIWQADGKSPRQTDTVFEIAWSIVPCERYEDAATEGAAVFARSRNFRPFAQVAELGEKCAVCGERTALPDGDRHNVKTTWTSVAESVPEKDRGFFRFDQTRLCLVCAVKRLFPRLVDRPARFLSFQHFEPEPERDELNRLRPSQLPYFALVALDGDRMGQVLGWVDEVKAGQLRAFHGALSGALGKFAADLRLPGDSQELNLSALGLDKKGFRPAPQLIYAGGDDVLLLCDVRAALPVARAIREAYVSRLRQAAAPFLADAKFVARLTTSGAILYAHTKQPAGSLFRDLHDLLDRKAKGEGGRDALALRLAKRGGVPVEVALKWAPTAEEPGVATLAELADRLAGSELASRQSFSLREDARVLTTVFEGRVDRWEAWIGERLSRAEIRGTEPAELAKSLAPFFVHGKTEALRIARFLGKEVQR